MEPKQLQVQTLPAPTQIPAGFLLLAIRALGICGSDVHYWQHGGLGTFKLTSPMVIGHECAGEVLALGAGVDSHKPGDRVALEPGISCRQCPLCLSGSYNLCPDMQFFATPPVHGSLCRYVLHPAALCFLLPPSLSYEQGAFCEPMSVGVMACTRAGLRPGMKAAVMGAGPIGLITMLVAKAFGASRVVMTDVDARRLQVGKDAGADGVVEVGKKEQQEVVRECERLLGGQADVSFDCVGLASTANTAIALTRSGGLLLTIGLSEAQQLLNAADISIREVDIRGIFRYRHTYPTCIDLLSSGRVSVDRLITHRIALAKGGKDDWAMDEASLLDGFEIARTGRDGAIKVMFTM